MKVRYQWTGDLREALAASVEKREKLWKKFPVVSHDVELRAKLWAEVADELTEQFGVFIDTDDMKRTWKNLKDNYWRISKMYEVDPLKPRRWRFYNCLRFMDRANIDETQLLEGDSTNRPSSSHSSSYDSRCVPDTTASRLLNGDDDGHSSGSDFDSIQEGSEHGKDRNRMRNHHYLTQISIPEIERFIETKQKPLTGAEIYCIPVDDVEDDLTLELQKVWSRLDAANHEDVDEQVENEPKSNENEGNPKDRAAQREKAEQMARHEKELKEAQETNRLLELVKLSTELHTVNEEARAIVTNCTTKLRGIYHQAALSLFIKENMPSGQLQILVDAFDDLIYDKKLNKEILSKVVKMCDATKQEAFEALFTIFERHGYALNLRRPEDRWAQIDNEARQNIDRIFKKQQAALPEIIEEKKKTAHQLEKEGKRRIEMRRKRSHETSGTPEEDQQNLIHARYTIAKQMVEETSTIESTKALLEMVEPGDHETREELENTLRVIEDMHEKTMKEKKILDEQCREMQLRMISTKRRKTTDARDSDDSSSRSDSGQLFNGGFKAEHST